MTDPYFERTLIHECDVAAPQISRSNAERQVSYGTASTIACRFYALSERWANEARGRQITREHRMMLKPDAAIGRRYQVTNIKIASSGTSIDSGPYVITRIEKYGDGQGLHHIEVEMERTE
jgi:hypothetical protein